MLEFTIPMDIESTLVSVGPFLDATDIGRLSCTSQSIHATMERSDTFWRARLLDEPFGFLPDKINKAAAEHDGGIVRLYNLLGQAQVSADKRPDAWPETLRGFPYARSLVVKTLEYIALRCETDTHVREELCIARTPDAVRKVLKLYPMDREVQLVGMDAITVLLRPLACSSGNSVARFKGHVVDLDDDFGDITLAAVQNHTSDACVLNAAARAAANTAFAKNNYDWLAKHHFDVALFRAMSPFIVDNITMRLQCITALINTVDPTTFDTESHNYINMACSTIEMFGNAAEATELDRRSILLLSVYAKRGSPFVHTQRVRSCVEIVAARTSGRDPHVLVVQYLRSVIG